MPIPDHFYPYWSVYDHRGEKYCDCSHEKYAIRTVELHDGEGFSYRRRDAPKPLPPYFSSAVIPNRPNSPIFLHK